MNILELLDDLHIPYMTEGHHHCRDGWAQVDCPFCGRHSQKWHMGINLGYGYANCWRCGKRWIVDVLAELTGLTTKELKPLFKTVEYLGKSELKPRGALKVPRAVGELTRAHKNYLIKRGFDWKEIAKLWDVKGIGISTRLGWRLFIPIEYQGEMVSWTTRSIGEHPARYITASPNEESLNHRDLLYGEDYCRHAVVVHEGPTDVWATGPGAVATLSTNYSQAQVLKISKYPRRVVCFDNQGPAQRRQRMLCRDLQMFDGETISVTLDSKDAGSARNKELKLLRSYLK